MMMDYEDSFLAVVRLREARLSSWIVDVACSVRHSGDDLGHTSLLTFCPWGRWGRSLIPGWRNEPD